MYLSYTEMHQGLSLRMNIPSRDVAHNRESSPSRELQVPMAEVLRKKHIRVH